MKMSVIFFLCIVITKLSLFDPTAPGPNYFNGINCTDQCDIVAFDGCYCITEMIAKCLFHRHLLLLPCILKTYSLPKI